MNRQLLIAAVFVVASAGVHAENARAGATLTIANTGEQFMVRKFDNGEECSATNRGKYAGISGRNLHRGERNDRLEIELTPGQPSEIVLASASGGARFRVEPEAGVDYLAQLRRSEGQTTLSLHSRARGSDGPFQLIENPPVATFRDDHCPEARWSRIEYRAPASPSVAVRESRSRTQVQADWQERHEIANYSE